MQPPLNFAITDADIFRNDDVPDPNGVPLLTVNIHGRNAVFAKQLVNARVFNEHISANVLVRFLRDSKVYKDGEGWLTVNKKDIEKLLRHEKNTFGQSALEALLAPISPEGETLIFEEAAIWLLARSTTIEGKELSKFLVRTFLDIRDGHYIAADGNERIKARLQYTASETDLQDTVYQRGLRDIGFFKVQGDQAFYGGLTTAQVKARKGIPQDRPLADFDSSIELTAKTLAKKATEHNIKSKNIKGNSMVFEYKRNNESMRDFLVKTTGITPEDTAKQSDIKLAQKEARKQLTEKAKGGVKKII